MLPSEARVTDDVLRANRAAAARADEEARCGCGSQVVGAAALFVETPAFAAAAARIAAASPAVATEMARRRHAQSAANSEAAERYRRGLAAWRSHVEEEEFRAAAEAAALRRGRRAEDPEFDDAAPSAFASAKKRRAAIVGARALADRTTVAGAGASPGMSASSHRGDDHPVRMRGRPIGTSDIINSEAGFRQVLSMLSKQAESNPIAFFRNQAARVPPMLTPQERAFAFVDNNRLVPDPEAEDATARSLCVWSEEDRETFRRRFAMYPKNFPKIAEGFGGKKTTEDVVEFFYKNKHSMSFRKQPPLKRVEGPPARVKSEKPSGLQQLLFPSFPSFFFFFFWSYVHGSTPFCRHFLEPFC